MSEEDEEKITQKSKAVMVLEAQMMFYHEKAEGLIAEIVDTLKTLRARPEVIVTMYKEFQKCADHARDCAAKLAPYQSPRLESIENKSKVTHKFVIRAPDRVKDSKEWLEHAKNDQKLIEAQANIGN